MGNFDHKNICILVKTKENFTDPRFVEFMKDWKFTEKEYDVFFDSVWDTISNEYSKKIVEFFISYNDGIILPDRCGVCEPLAHNFNKNDISAPVKWLSQPGGSLMLKKRYKFDVDIENETFAVVFTDGEMSPPKGILPEYLGKTTFRFSKQRKIDMGFLETLLRDFCTYLNADNGIIFDQETHEVLVDIFR